MDGGSIRLHRFVKQTGATKQQISIGTILSGVSYHMRAKVNTSVACVKQACVVDPPATTLCTDGKNNANASLSLLPTVFIQGLTIQNPVLHQHDECKLRR